MTRIVHEQLRRVRGDQLMPEQVPNASSCTTEDRPILPPLRDRGRTSRSIFTRRAELPSGGSIVFDQTEALVAIDVNSGRTRSSTGSTSRRVALKTNLEAVPEIARQIRLRDLGGIIVCDFIDMMRPVQPCAACRACLARRVERIDRARSKLGRISQFGLLGDDASAARVQGTHKKVFQSLPSLPRYGTYPFSVQSRAAAILRRLGSALTQKGFSDGRAVRPSGRNRLPASEELFDYVRALEHRFEKEIHPETGRSRPARGQRAALPAGRRARGAPRWPAANAEAWPLAACRIRAAPRSAPANWLAACQGPRIAFSHPRGTRLLICQSSRGVPVEEPSFFNRLLIHKPSSKTG